MTESATRRDVPFPDGIMASSDRPAAGAKEVMRMTTPEQARPSPRFEVMRRVTNQSLPWPITWVLVEIATGDIVATFPTLEAANEAVAQIHADSPGIVEVPND